MLLDFTSKCKELKNLKVSSELARLNAELMEKNEMSRGTDVEGEYSDVVGGPWDLPPAA